MVIGNGLVATRFKEYDRENKFLIFASGVSNSKITSPEVYNREIALLNKSIQQNPDKIICYLSTCSIYDPDEKGSTYVQHKLHIEEIIQLEVKHYHIFRVSNLAGKSGNPNTVLNFIFYHVQHGINFDLWSNACRNILDIDNAYGVMDHILKNDLFLNQVINIANPTHYRVKDIVMAIERFLGIKSNYIEIDKGSCFDIDLELIRPIIQELKIGFGPEYLDDVLSKYFQVDLDKN